MSNLAQAGLWSLISVVVLSMAQGCTVGSSSANYDDSASGAMAGVVGGVVNGSSGSGTPSHSEMMSHAVCPTMKTPNGSGCAESTTNYTMTYSDCNFSGEVATWNGSQVVTLGSGSATCGVFPTSTFTRTFGSGTTRTSVSGLVVTLDTSANDLNFELFATGGGETVSFTSGSRSAIAIPGIHLTSTLFDHSIYTNSPLTVSTSGSTTTVSGTVVVLHNLLRIRGTGTVNMTFTAGCCFPTGGTISTAFDAGSSGGESASKYIGKTESLAFTATCGQATYTGITGSPSTVTLAHCF